MNNPVNTLNVFKAHFRWKHMISEPNLAGVFVYALPIVVFNMIEEKEGSPKCDREGYELYNKK